ncbi:MAG: hypothetical protein DMG67_04040 [Acidobacteria bacterium]|nr:MAG: hypothetical protein DMG67_04040 [Acidobacteriota bacterium]
MKAKNLNQVQHQTLARLLAHDHWGSCRPPGGWRGRPERSGKAGLAYLLGMMVSIFFTGPLSHGGTVVLAVQQQPNVKSAKPWSHGSILGEL